MPRMLSMARRPLCSARSFRDFDADDGASVGVFCGAGGTFCAGADLKEFSSAYENHRSRLNPEGDAPMGPSRLRLTKPVIAAVSGYAVAGGLELALWCDLRVMEESAVFGVFCRRFGVPLIDGGTIRLPRPDRHEPSAGFDAHRAAGRRSRGPGNGTREPCSSGRSGSSRLRKNWRHRSLVSLSAV